MAPRASIVAGQTVIVITAKDLVDRTFKQVERKANLLAFKLSKIGTGLTFGGTFAGFLQGRTLQQFSSFEDSILFLRTKVEATKEEFMSLEETILHLGRTTSFTAGQVAEGAVSLAQAGFSTQEIENSLQAVLDLARASRVEFSTAAQILANQLRTFNKEASEASRVADGLVLAARRGTLNLIDLGESLKEVVGTSKSLNLSLNDTVAVITQMAFASLRGTKAGTSLNTLLLNIQNKSQTLKRLGVAVPSDLSGDKLFDFLDKLDERVKKLTPSARTAVLQRLFNIRGARAANAILDVTKKARDLASELDNVNGEARKAALTMDSRLGGAARIARSALEDLNIGFQRLVEGPIIKALKLVPAVALSFKQLAETNPDIARGIAALPAIAVASGVALIGLSFAIRRVVGVGKLLTGIFGLGTGFVSRGIASNVTALGLAFTLAVSPIRLFTSTIRKLVGLGGKKKGGIIKMLFGAPRALIAYGAILRRFIFSTNGLLLMVELFLLFGRNTDLLANSLEFLKKTLSSVLKPITQLGRQLKEGPFKLINLGFNEILGGRTALGIQDIITGFKTVVQLVGIKLQEAWFRFMSRIEPFLNRVIRLALVIKAVFETTFAAIGSVLRPFGNIRFPGGNVNRQKDNEPLTNRRLAEIISGSLQFAFENLLNVLLETTNLLKHLNDLITTMVTNIAQLFKELFTPGTFMGFIGDFVGGDKAAKIRKDMDDLTTAMLAGNLRLNKTLINLENGLKGTLGNLNGIFQDLPDTLETALNFALKPFGAKADHLADEAGTIMAGLRRLISFRQADKNGIFSQTGQTIANYFAGGGLANTLKNVFEGVFKRQQQPQGTTLDLLKGLFNKAIQGLDPQRVAQAQAQAVRQDAEERLARQKRERIALQETLRQLSGFGGQALIPERQRLREELKKSIARENQLRGTIGANSNLQVNRSRLVQIAEIVGTVVGEIANTRRNNVLALSENNTEDQLEQIITNTGGTSDRLDRLLTKVGPLVLQ